MDAIQPGNLVDGLHGAEGSLAALQGFRDAAEALEVSNELSVLWIPSLSSIVIGPPADRAADLASLATEASRCSEDHRPPISLQVWLAASAPDRAGQVAAASDVLGRLGAHERKLALGRRGVEAVGTFAFSLGLASVAYYQFELGSYASLWLVPPWPLDRAGLEARAGVSPSAAKPTKR